MTEKIDFNKVKWRFEGKQWYPKRFKVYQPWDKISGGLPISLTIFAGEPGTGKSLLARSLAIQADNKGYEIIYILCESYADSPAYMNPNTGIHIGDYTRFIPNWKRALEELWVAQEHFDADFIVIDSVTQFFSGTKKAVEEADIRTALRELSTEAENRGVAVLGTSEVRGSGSFLYPAGGRAVDHRAWLYVWFDKLVANRWDAKEYGIDIGDKIYTIEFVKDKHGLADASSIYVVEYPEAYKPRFIRMRDYIAKKKNKEDDENGKGDNRSGNKHRGHKENTE